MTTENLIRQRMARQRLTMPADAETVGRDLIALQAQYWRNAVHALRIRSSTAPDWENWCKTWSLRGTLHLCREADLPLLLREGRKHDLRPQDKTDDADVYLDGTLCLTAARKRHWRMRIPAMVDAGIDTREGLREACAAEGMTEDEARCVFDPWGGLLRGLCEAGILVYCAQEEKTFRRCGAFVPLSDVNAGQELARRYFTHYGPASIKDAAQFFGVTQTTVKRWVKELPLEVHDWEGRRLFTLPCPGTVPDIPDCVFLAGFDPLLMGYDRQTNPILPPEYLRKIYTLAGIVHAPILLRGRIVGRWKQAGRKLELTPFEIMSTDVIALVEDAGRELFGDMRIVWREIV